ncbi:MAG: CapA family protein [Gemmatimonadetes bacterium]|nr:CapA family protein [Gemmatimonadota bacterium]
MKRCHVVAVLAAVALAASLVPAAGLLGAQEVTLVAGGDVEWSRFTKEPDVFMDPPRRQDATWIQIPYLNNPTSRAHLESKGQKLEDAEDHHIAAIKYGLEFKSPAEMARYPYQRIADVLRSADIAIHNLETPLSDKARHSGAFRTPAAFADGLRWAGVDVVATANNHALDAEGEGLVDTREALWRAGIGAVGTGRDLEDARRPFIVERQGMKVGFLGYSQFVNAGSSAFAQPERAGVVPLDPFIIKEDIRRLREQVDYVVVSFHWGVENSQDTHADQRKFAHEIIDAGADVIVGHHPHVPRGVEVYKGKVIFYSLGNLIFGHAHTYWMDNYLGRLTLARDGIKKVEILPISGRGNNLGQPRLLEGDAARALLEDIQKRTAQLDTQMEVQGNIGVILPQAQERRAGSP